MKGRHNTLRAASLRHVTKIPSRQLLYFPHLQNLDARNSFRFRSCKKCRVSPAFSSQSVDTLIPLDATLIKLPVSVANKRPAPRLTMAKPCRCNTYKKHGGREGLRIAAFRRSTLRRLDVLRSSLTERRRGLGRSGRRHRDWIRGRLARWEDSERWADRGRGA